MATENISQANGLRYGALVGAHPSVRPKVPSPEIDSAWSRDSL